MDNPFSHSGIVTGEAFCNREKDIADLAYRSAHSQNTLLFSHRRMGKTSLVHRLIHQLEHHRPKIGSVYIDLYGTVDEKGFIEAVFTGLTQVESKIEKLLKLASGLKFSGSVDPLTGQPSVSISINPNDHPKYLNTAMNALSAYSEKSKLLVVFDEFQEIDRYTEKGFAKRLRSHIQQHTNIAYIFARGAKNICSLRCSTPLTALFIKWPSATP